MLAYLAAAPAITYGRLRRGEVVKLPHTRLSPEARRLDGVNTYILGALFAYMCTNNTRSEVYN